MEQLFPGIINNFFKVRDFFSGILEPALPFLYIAAFILSAFFVWGIIYSILGSGYIKRKIDLYADKFGWGDVSKIRQLRVWKKILERLKSKDMTQWKLAVLEADALFDEILKHTGIRGADIHERFKQFPSTSISNYEQLIQAHRVRDRVSTEADFILSHEDALAVIKIYEQTFKELGLIS